MDGIRVGSTAGRLSENVWWLASRVSQCRDHVRELAEQVDERLGIGRLPGSLPVKASNSIRRHRR
jgi:hypothetical protein